MSKLQKVTLKRKLVRLVLMEDDFAIIVSPDLRNFFFYHLTGNFHC